MKLIIGKYEVDVKAKTIGTEKKFSKNETMDFLLDLAIWAFEAGFKYDLDGLHAISKVAREAASDIHNALEKERYFIK